MSEAEGATAGQGETRDVGVSLRARVTWVGDPRRHSPFPLGSRGEVRDLKHLGLGLRGEREKSTGIKAAGRLP